LVGLALFLGLLGGGAAWLSHVGWFARQADSVVAGLYALSAQAGLSVREVQAEGRKYTARDDILEALGVERGMPIFAFKPWPAKDRLERLPWVRRAVVERRLPDLIRVRLQEREPLARWQVDRAKFVIDSTGSVIVGADVRQFPELPLVVGNGAQVHAAELLAMLKREPAIYRQLGAAVRVGQRRWNLQLLGGISVRLPEENPPGALRQLARLERDHDVLKRGVSVIDLRLPDRLVVRMAPDARESNNGGEET
jgi:cell division protein FtsQ